MAARPTQTFRVPLLLLTVANLAALGAILWPWQQAARLPQGGTAAIDPAVTLLAYLGLVLWLSSGARASTRQALGSGARMGLVAGLVLAARVLLDARIPAQPAWMQPGLLAVAAVLWGVAGLRGARATGNAGVGALAGLWSAMVSGLLGSAAVLAQLLLAGPAPATADPWKQYQGLAIGNAITQGLVSALNTATGFLLLGPLAGAVLGLVFAYFGGGPKPARSA